MARTDVAASKGGGTAVLAQACAAGQPAGPSAAPAGAAGGLLPPPAPTRNPAAEAVALTREECRPADMAAAAEASLDPREAAVVPEDRAMVRAATLLTGADRNRLAAVRGNMRPAFVVDFCDGRGAALVLEDTMVPAGSIVQRTSAGQVRVIAGCRGG